MLPRAAAALAPSASAQRLATASGQCSGLGRPAAALPAGGHRRPATAASFRLCSRPGRPPRPGRSPAGLSVRAFTSGSDAVKSALEALKEEHGKPSDREVAAAATAAMAAAATSLEHSKSALGYLFREAPLRTWLPLLACAAGAAAGLATGRPRALWAAAGGALAFALTVWQVLAPLIRRFIQLRAHLLENDRAAKHRLDAAAHQVTKAAEERERAVQERQQAQAKLRQLGAAIRAAAASCGGGSQQPGGSREPVVGDGDGGDGLQAVRQLEALLQAQRQQDERLAGVLGNALHAAAVPARGPSACADGSADMDALDGYAERSVDPSNPLELAGALQSRVDALRRQAQDAAALQEELAGLHEQMRERADAAAALQAQLELARGEARAHADLAQRLKAVEVQLRQERDQREAQQRRAAEAERAAVEARGAAAQQARRADEAQRAAEQEARRAREAEEACAAAEEARAAVVAAAPSSAHAEDVARQLDGLRAKLARAERHLARYGQLVPSLEGSLGRLRHRQAQLEAHQEDLERQHAEDEALLEEAVETAMQCCEVAAGIEGLTVDGLRARLYGGGSASDGAGSGDDAAAAGERGGARR